MVGFDGGIELGISGLSCLGYQQLTVANAAAGVGLTIPLGTKSAVVECEANALTTGKSIRFREDGNITAPTAAIGMFLLDGTPYLVRVGCLTTIRFISADAVNSQLLNITYYG